MRFKNLRTGSPGSWFILSALAAALVAGVLVYKAISLAVPTEPVIVAKMDLEPGQTLTEEVLEVREFPRAAVPGDRITGSNYDEMIGRHVRTFIAAGDPVRTRHLAELSPGGGTVSARLSYTGRPEWRAVALPAEASRGLEVVPGDRLDVIGTVDVPGARGNFTVTRVLVWGAPVISVPANAGGEPGREESGVAVALTPGDAERVSLAMARGKVLVALNPLGQVTGQQSRGVTEEELFTGGSADVAGK